jgi:PIN domain nuclease of toxin-antitoxin system
MNGDRFLLDSHILLWLDWGNSRITPQLLERLRYADHRYLSAATAWELSLKRATGRLHLASPISAMLSTFRLEELSVTTAHGDRAASLPPLHGDPFDRMLLAQAMEERLILVTADRKLADYNTPVILV